MNSTIQCKFVFVAQMVLTKQSGSDPDKVVKIFYAVGAISESRPNPLIIGKRPEIC